MTNVRPLDPRGRHTAHCGWCGSRMAAAGDTVAVATGLQPPRQISRRKKLSVVRLEN